MVNKIVVHRSFFANPDKSDEYNLGFEEGIKKGIELGRKEGTRMVQQFKKWADLQDKIQEKKNDE